MEGTRRGEIHWPDGFALDNAQNPGPVEFGPPGYYNLKMLSNKVNDLTAEREFVFGRQGFLNFSVEAYSRVKTVFDTIHANDGVSIALKLAAGSTQGAR